jgi:lipopolysaccharide transport system ATP-binding protein
MNNVLEVRNISKVFKDYNSGFARILSWCGFSNIPSKEYSILDDINFSITSGEAVGIIGKNGAGKSTLLKIITQTLKPTKGFITLNGKISAILELGMGFNPDLTGRQNAYNTLGMMGYAKNDIDMVIEEVANFADINEYFDQPIRIYSSGMQARVAFAVATAFRPEILIVDEALSVGDIFFGIKCIEKMEAFKKDGTSILLVTHDMGTLRRFCDKGIVLENGKKSFEGDVLDAISLYSLRDNKLECNEDKRSNKTSNIPLDNINYLFTEFSPNIATVEKMNLWNKNKKQINVFEQNSMMYFTCSFKLLQKLVTPYFHISIVNAQNLVLYAKNSFQQNLSHNEYIDKNNLVEFSGEFQLCLAPGKYIFIFALHSIDNHILNLEKNERESFIHSHRKVIITAKIEVEITRSNNGLEFFGLVDLPSKWEI